jgi:osmoprotectant transport system permease protein
MSYLEFLQANLSDLGMRIWQHVALCGVTLTAAGLLAVPTAVLLTRTPRAAAMVMGAVSIVQTIPSLALLGFLLAVTGKIGYVPSIIALFLYSLLPIVRNTYAGIQQTPGPIVFAAEAMGLTSWQIIREVKVPLAMPVIVAGFRTAAVSVIGTATLCAFIGAGGLGVYINRGIETVNPMLVSLGVVPVAALALLVDWLLGRVGKALSPPAAVM